jgi:PBP superfamily domain
MPRRRPPASFFSFPCLFLLFLSAAGIFVLGQSAEQFSEVKKLYVDSLGTNQAAALVRNDLLRRLRSNHEIQIVSDRNEADAALKGTAEIWTIGHNSLDPHAKGTVESIKEGFLSVELVGKNNQTLWSYLVTPSKVSWGGVANDLARQAVGKLLAARASSGTGASVAAPAPSTAATLKGAGATFPAPLYQKWFQLFEETHPGVRISYDAVGSAAGIQRLQAGDIDLRLRDALNEYRQPAPHQAASHGSGSSGSHLQRERIGTES